MKYRKQSRDDLEKRCQKGLHGAITNAEGNERKGVGERRLALHLILTMMVVRLLIHRNRCEIKTWYHYRTQRILSNSRSFPGI